MGTSPLMSMGIKAMAANYAALQTTSHNIANANVAGYSRQQVELATAQGQFSGAGFFGKGVNVVAVTRTHNEFLTLEAASARSLAGMDAARLEQLQRLEGFFRSGEAGLGHASSEFLNAMVDLASRPADAAARQVVLARARTSPRASAKSARHSTSRRPASMPNSSHGGRGQQPGPEHRRRQRAHRRIARRRAAAERPARRARPADREPVAACPGQPHRSRRRLDGHLHRRRPTPGAGQRGGELEMVPDASDPSRSAVGSWKAASRGRSAKKAWAAARSPACCASRTTT